MTLNKIEFVNNGINYYVEEIKSGGYFIDISKKDGVTLETIIHFRTDDLDLTSLIEALEFIKNYNFIQEK